MRGFHAAQRMRFIEEKDFARRMCVCMNRNRCRVEGGRRDDYQRGGSEPGDGYLLEFWIGVEPGGRILDPIIITVGYPGDIISCSIGRRL